MVAFLRSLIVLDLLAPTPALPRWGREIIDGAFLSLLVVLDFIGPRPGPSPLGEGDNSGQRMLRS